MKKVFLPVIVAAAFMLSGCSVINTSMPLAGASVPINLSPEQYEIVGDISGEAQVTYFLVFALGANKKYGTVETPGAINFKPFLPWCADHAKNMAVYNAIKKAKKVDYMIAPKFEIKDTNFVLFRTRNVKVTGKGVRVLQKS